MTEALLQPFVEPDQLKLDVQINLADITGGMVEQAGLYVHYASMTVRAKRQYERWKRAVEVLEAGLGSQYRKSLVVEEDDGKGKGGIKMVKPTEPQIKEAIHCDPRWKAASTKEIDAQEVYRLAEVAERAFDHRKDMLLQIARDAAREQQGPLRVAANQANSDRRDSLVSSMSAHREKTE
jgi:hypothetical protein